MPLAPGTRLGTYEIVAPLGAGGMGEVYRARDTRLGREVAIKVLPQHLSEQPAIEPRWTKGGKELVYEEVDGHVIAVPIDSGAGFHAGTPVTLFTLPEHAFGIGSASWNVSEDGTRFFFILPPQVRDAGVVEVVADFASLVGRK
jgi:serine/threonine protein kinase